MPNCLAPNGGNLRTVRLQPPMTAPAASFHEEDALGKAYDSRLMRRLLAYARPYHALTAAALFFLVIEGASPARRAVSHPARHRRRDPASRLRQRSASPWSSSRSRSSRSSGRAYAETWFTALLGQQRHARPAHEALLAPAAAADRVLRPESRGTTHHARDVGRRDAERAVHRRRRRGTRRSVHAARDQRRDARQRLAARARGVRGDPARRASCRTCFA